MAQIPRHSCLIYDGAPSALLPRIAQAFAEALNRNYRCLYLNAPGMVAELRRELRAAGVDTTAEEKRGALVASSSQEHLVEGAFDPQRMVLQLGSAVRRAVKDGYAGLWASGDMRWEFASEKNLSKLLSYEVLLESLFEAEPALHGMCQYHRDTLPASAVKVALYTHGAVHVNERQAQLNPHHRERATLRSAPLDASAHIDCMLEALHRV